MNLIIDALDQFTLIPLDHSQTYNLLEFPVYVEQSLKIINTKLSI